MKWKRISQSRGWPVEAYYMGEIIVGTVIRSLDGKPRKGEAPAPQWIAHSGLPSSGVDGLRCPSEEQAKLIVEEAVQAWLVRAGVEKKHE